MTNLEKIREAWRIGWAAVVKDEYGEIKIVDVAPLVVCGVFPDHTSASILVDNLEGVQILRYLYAGELAGNGKPREGQRFCRKKDMKGSIWVFNDNALHSKNQNCLWDLMWGEDWEPYFE